MAQRVVNGEQYQAVLLGGDVDGASISVDGRAYRSVVSFNRPGNASGYTAGDVVGGATSAIHTFSGVGPSGGSVLAQSASLLIGKTAVPSGMTGFRLHLFNSSPSAVADNAVFNVASGEIDAYMGYVDFPTPIDMGDVLFAQVDYIGRQLKLASGQTSIFAELETRGAYTPASGTAYQMRMSTLEVGLA
jgi:hypothetical protein